MLFLRPQLLRGRKDLGLLASGLRKRLLLAGSKLEREYTSLGSEVAFCGEGQGNEDFVDCFIPICPESFSRVTHSRIAYMIAPEHYLHMFPGGQFISFSGILLIRK